MKFKIYDTERIEEDYMLALTNYKTFHEPDKWGHPQLCIELDTIEELMQFIEDLRNVNQFVKNSSFFRGVIIDGDLIQVYDYWVE